MNQIELKLVLELHGKWLNSEEGGRRANLSDANLSVIKDDLYKVLNAVPDEVPQLLQSLMDGRVDGRVDGSVYEGECACLVGTIANIKKCNYREIEGLTPQSYRPIEKLFLGISEGDTPETNAVSRIVVQWINEWQASHPVKELV